jgi:hypothetical protein
MAIDTWPRFGGAEANLRLILWVAMAPLCAAWGWMLTRIPNIRRGEIGARPVGGPGSNLLSGNRFERDDLFAGQLVISESSGFKQFGNERLLVASASR